MEKRNLNPLSFHSPLSLSLLSLSPLSLHSPPGFKPTKSAPLTPAKPLGISRTRSESVHVTHKVLVGDSPYVRAKNVQRCGRLDSLLLTTLMGFYSSCVRCDVACKVFDEMSQRDTVAWNVLISCYTRNGRTRDALGVFDIMQSPLYGSEPDDVTCLLLLQACANLGALEFGGRIHKYIEEYGYGNALNLCNSLIAMYSRCGCLEKAYNVFKAMPVKVVVLLWKERSFSTDNLYFL